MNTPINIRNFKLLGLGSAIIDLQVLVEDEDLDNLGLKKGSMTLAPQHAQGKALDYFQARIAKQACGGSVANSILGFAQLLPHGVVPQTAFGCLVGDDPLGHLFIGEMRNSQVEVFSHTDPDLPTATCVCLVTPDAQRTLQTHLGASARFAPEYLPIECIAQSEWVYIEGYLLALERGRELVAKVVEIGEKSGARIALSLSASSIVQAFREEIELLVKNVDLVIANEEEGRALIENFGGAESVFTALAKDCSSLVLTLGENGALIKYGGRETYVPGFNVEAVDTTGAGDSFAAGFFYGITHGMSPEAAGRLGCFLASRVVAQLGPRLEGDVRTLCRSIGLL